MIFFQTAFHSDMADAMTDGLTAPEITKACGKCGEIKPLSQYHKNKRGKFGRRSTCISCDSIRMKAYAALHSEELKIKDKKYREANPDKARKRTERYRERHPLRVMESARKTRATNPDKARERAREYYRNNKEKELVRRKKYYADNPEKSKARNKLFRENNPGYDAEWRAKNPEKAKASWTKSFRKRLDTPKGKLEHAIKAGVRSSIVRGSKSGRKTFDLLGYTSGDLTEHLSKLFLPGMTWENYGEWHIDHVVPLSAHNYETPDDIDFKRAWALSNLQPLWATDNMKKHAKLSAPFQPSLALAA